MSIKKIMIMLFALILMLLGCSENNHFNSSNVKSNSFSVNRKQFRRISKVLKDNQIPTSVKQGVCIDDIKKIKSAKLGYFKVENPDVKKYYYNFFSFNNKKLTVVYNDKKLICGCIYFDKIVDSGKILTAKTFEDIKKADDLVNNDGWELSNCSVIYLISRLSYSVKNEFKPCSTLHFTKDGLYLVQYNGTINLNENVKIASIEKVDDIVYNKVYEIVCDNYL